MKKYISLFLTLIVIITALPSCAAGGKGDSDFSIVTTVFPVYDWTKNIVGDVEGVDITMLLDSGVDLHSYQPTADDIIRISSCDVFIYVGGESDEWVSDALKEATNKEMTVIDLMEVLGDAVKEEEIVEGMEAEEDGGEQEETEYDEHIWLSLKNAEIITEKIASTLAKKDEKNADKYRSNAEKYSGKIAALDKKYEETVEKAKFDTLVFGDRFPFRYLTDDYNINYYAAFVGCSAESEASFETISFLAKKVDEYSLGAVMTLEGTEHKIAETVIASTNTKNAKILTLDSMQSTTGNDAEDGADYLEIMEKNLLVLSEALN